MKTNSLELLVAFSCYLIFASIIVLPFVWQPVYGLLLDGVFWQTALQFVLSGAVIAYLFRKRGASSRAALFTLGSLLIFSAASLKMGLAQIAENHKFWEPLFGKSWSDFFVWVRVAVSHAEDIVAFGIAAIGANIMVAAMLDCEKKNTLKMRVNDFHGDFNKRFRTFAPR
jgi:hypothetical protein